MSRSPAISTIRVPGSQPHEPREGPARGRVEQDQFSDRLLPPVPIAGHVVTQGQFGRLPMTYASWPFRIDIRQRSGET